MKVPLTRAVAMLVVCLSLAGMGAEPLKPEPLRPFSDIERMFFRGALIVAGIVAAWFTIVVIRGWFRERRQARARQDPPLPPDQPSP